MSLRFGRNQRRRAREEQAQLAAKLQKVSDTLAFAATTTIERGHQVHAPTCEIAAAKAMQPRRSALIPPEAWKFGGEPVPHIDPFFDESPDVDHPLDAAMLAEPMSYERVPLDVVLKESMTTTCGNAYTRAFSSLAPTCSTPSAPPRLRRCAAFERGDMTSIWLMQRIGPEHRFIRYYEASGEELNHFSGWLQDQGLTYAKHFLPHEAAYKRIGKTPDTNQSIEEMLQELLPSQRFDVVPRVTNLDNGIQATRAAFASSWFSEQGGGVGLSRLSNYRKKWDQRNGRFTSEPRHNDDSHGSDAYRQFGQVLEAGEKFAMQVAAAGGRATTKRRGTSPMAV